MTKKLEIIAEIAQGYEGNLDLCLLYIRAAKKAKADAVKFQMVYADDLCVPEYKYYKLFKSLELKRTDWQEITRFCHEMDIQLQVDIFGEKSLNMVSNIGLGTIKLHGTDTNNLNLLKAISSSSINRIILGIGGANLKEIDNAVTILNNKNITLMHGFQGYPTPVNCNQISRIKYLNDYFINKGNLINFGFGDHSDNDNSNLNLSISLSSLALAFGATTIEKHLTLSNIVELEDYESALNPDNFSTFSEILNKTFYAIGKIKNTNDFGMDNKEINYRNTIRRDVVAKKDIQKGTQLTKEHLTLKRTPNKNSIKDIETLYGKKITASIKQNDNLMQEMFEDN